MRRDFPRKEKILVMANVGQSAPRSAIAGPRRVRPPSSKRLKAASAAPAAPAAPAGPAARVAAARDLPALDYDSEASARTRIAPPPKHLVAMTASPSAPGRSKRFRWFVLGVLLGALIVSAVRGDAAMTVRAARAWGANHLRALKKNPPMQLGPTSAATSLATQAPCDLTDEECAMLLAPFAAANALPEQQQDLASRAIPEVDVMSLKRVKAPVAYVAPPPKLAPTALGDPASPAEDATPSADPPRASPSPAPLPSDTADTREPRPLRADMNGPLAVTPSPRVFIP